MVGLDLVLGMLTMTFLLTSSCTQPWYLNMGMRFAGYHDFHAPHMECVQSCVGRLSLFATQMFLFDANTSGEWDSELALLGLSFAEL